MGLFDRKRPEEDFPAPAPAPAPDPAPKAAAAPKPASKPSPEPAKPAAPTKAAEPAKPTYGIQNAIELMRQLPEDNVALVVNVVKKTLESLHVDIGSIVTDAKQKQTRIDERVARLRIEIADFEEEIAARKDEIEALTADRDETETVRQRLEQALGTPSSGPIPSASIPPPGGMTSGTIG